MKKIKYMVFLILMVFPFTIKASTASISGVSLEGNDGVTVGTSFYESFGIKFSNIRKGTSDTLGIWVVGFELDYDDDVFIVEDIVENGKVWISNIYKDGNKKYVISQFNNSSFNVDACVDRVLYCADYMITLKFYVKDTEKKNTEIKMKDIEARVFQVSGDMNPEYSTDDMIELAYSSEKIKKISIDKPNNVEIKEKESIISNSKPKVSDSKVSSKKTTNTKKTNNNLKTEKKKSDNSNLKDLGVSGYSIDFAKDKTNYNIRVKGEVNSLKIKALPEDEKATVEIVGADDLESNEGKVIINVKAENGDTNSYTIVVEKEEIVITEKEEKYFGMSEKQITIVGIVIGSILFIIILIFLIIRIYDRKVNKAIDSM